MCAGPVWTLTGPSCGCRSSCSSPNLALDLSHTWWRCHPVSVCSMATFSYEDWVPLSDTVAYFWVQCLFQAFKEIKRHYAALLRFIHLSLVYRGLLCMWCRCVLVQFGHLLALYVAVSPPVPVRILPWTYHTPSGEDATSFCVQYGYFSVCMYICPCSVCWVLSSFCLC